MQQALEESAIVPACTALVDQENCGALANRISMFVNFVSTTAKSELRFVN